MTQPAPQAPQMSMDCERTLRPYRIALLNPNTSERATQQMLTSAWSVAPFGVHIEGRTVLHGQDLITNAEALALAAQAVLETVPALVAEGFDAIIVAGFGDPGVAELRQRLAVPVVGLGEAGMAEAASGGLRYAIVTVTPDLHERLVAAAHAAAPADQFTGVRYTRGDSDSLMRDPERLQAALLLACEEAIALDGAQAIVIGGGPLAFAAAALAAQLQLRVVNPVCAAVRHVCSRADLPTRLPP
jgi:allantoin racemase